jgi:hypothetical protein
MAVSTFGGPSLGRRGSSVSSVEERPHRCRRSRLVWSCTSGLTTRNQWQRSLPLRLVLHGLRRSAHSAGAGSIKKGSIFSRPPDFVLWIVLRVVVQATETRQSPFPIPLASCAVFSFLLLRQALKLEPAPSARRSSVPEGLWSTEGRSSREPRHSPRNGNEATVGLWKCNRRRGPLVEGGAAVGRTAQ